MRRKPRSNDGNSRKGFASMTPARRRELSAKGGAAVKPQNRAFSKDRDLASSAGRKGGFASQSKQED